MLMYLSGKYIWIHKTHVFLLHEPASLRAIGILTLIQQKEWLCKVIFQIYHMFLSCVLSTSLH